MDTSPTSYPCISAADGSQKLPVFFESLEMPPEKIGDTSNMDSILNRVVEHDPEIPSTRLARQQEQLDVVWLKTRQTGLTSGMKPQTLQTASPHYAPAKMSMTTVSVSHKQPMSARQGQCRTSQNDGY